ncbi:MAG: hypothetical protein IT379_11890 [Deltaproteobacteria bacterium]|nr:hypothetical protein [Deltaproteobacteria bacterium]
MKVREIMNTEERIKARAVARREFERLRAWSLQRERRSPNEIIARHQRKLDKG